MASTATRTPRAGVSDVRVLVGEATDEGTPVTVVARVESDASTTVPVRLWLFGEVVNATTVDVPAGESRTVEFRHVLAGGGRYEAAVNGVSQTFTVEEGGERDEVEGRFRGEADASAGTPGFTLLVAVVALLAAGALAVRGREP